MVEELTKGFRPYPSTFLVTNWDNLVHGTLPIFNGLINSLIVATLTAVFATYFSTMTAYAIHAYDFKLKKFIFTFILMVMMIPTQVTALGFLQLIGKMGLDDKFTPLIVPAIASGVLNKEKPKKEGGFGDKVMNLYARFLRKCLKYKPVVFITMIALLVLSIFLAVNAGLFHHIHQQQLQFVFCFFLILQKAHLQV